jgi:plasmid segregation protein ParM
MRLGVDAGNFRVKICGEAGLMDFLSAIGESRDINLQQIHGIDDMYFQYEGMEGFAGSLAIYESEFSGSIMGDTKAHYDTKLRILLGIHRYTTLYNIQENNFKIVVGQPIVKHNPSEKERIRNLIKGDHTITVNGIKKTFSISAVEVAAEGATSYISNPTQGLVRILDVGSATVNYSTILNGRFIDRESGTLPFGANTNKSNSLQFLTRGIATHILKKWNSNDKVFIIGGASEQLLPYLRDYLTDVQILHPIYKKKFAHYAYANAVAFYNLAVNIYE